MPESVVSYSHGDRRAHLSSKSYREIFRFTTMAFLLALHSHAESSTGDLAFHCMNFLPGDKQDSIPLWLSILPASQKEREETPMKLQGMGIMQLKTITAPILQWAERDTECFQYLTLSSASNLAPLMLMSYLARTVHVGMQNCQQAELCCHLF